MVRRRILPVGGPEEMLFGTNNTFFLVRQGLGQPNGSLIVLVDDAEAHESQRTCRQNREGYPLCMFCLYLFFSSHMWMNIC
jgi:hypothetical protein